MPTLTAPLLPLPCRRCGLTIGYSDGTRLKLGSAWCTLPTTLRCVGCGAKRRWWPDA